MSTRRLMLVFAALLFAGCGQALQTAPTVQPTAVATNVPTTRAAAPTKPPAPQSSSTPVPTPPTTPSVAPEPAQRVLGALQEPLPQTGRGLGVEPAAVATPAPPAAAPPAPTYLEVVAEQAPHSPRGDGKPGPSGAGSGDWAIVPTLAPEQLQVVQQQKPHKVR